MEIHQRNKFSGKIRFILFIIMILSVSIGSYFIIHSKREAKEKTRIARQEQEDRESRKIERLIFGYSTKGRPIEGYEIGNGKDTLMLIASIHGGEKGSAYLMDQLVEEIRADPDLISKNKKIVIIPIMNPDGFYERTDKYNANGVNLNLNFPTLDWQEYGPGGTYGGPKPLSEVESRLIKELIERYDPRLLIDFQSQGALVAPELNDQSIALAKWYVDKTGYEFHDLWDYPGTHTKWFVENYDRPAITIELTEYLESDWEINRDALLELVSSDTMPL